MPWVAGGVLAAAAAGALVVGFVFGFGRDDRPSDPVADAGNKAVGGTPPTGAGKTGAPPLGPDNVGGEKPDTARKPDGAVPAAKPKVEEKGVTPAAAARLIARIDEIAAEWAGNRNESDREAVRERWQELHARCAGTTFAQVGRPTAPQGYHGWTADGRRARGTAAHLRRRELPNPSVPNRRTVRGMPFPRFRGADGLYALADDRAVHGLKGAETLKITDPGGPQGRLTVTPAAGTGGTQLAVAGGRFADFDFRAKVRLNSNAVRSGFMLFYRGHGTAAKPIGWQLLVHTGFCWLSRLQDGKPALIRAAPAAIASGEWADIRLVVVGDAHRLYVNDACLFTERASRPPNRAASTWASSAKRPTCGTARIAVFDKVSRKPAGTMIGTELAA